MSDPDRDDEDRKRNEESGKYEASYPTGAFVDAVEDLGPAAGTQEIADRVGCNRDTAYRRLRRLEEDGVVESRKVGMARLWTATGGG